MVVGTNHENSPRRPGRPSALTPDTEARILNAIRCGAPNRVACAAAGIGESTLYQWLEKGRERPESDYAEFAERLTRARQEGITARLALIQKAAVKDWRAAAWLLERDMPEEFSLRFKIEHQVPEKPFTLADATARLREGPESRGFLPDPSVSPEVRMKALEERLDRIPKGALRRFIKLAQSRLDRATEVIDSP